MIRLPNRKTGHPTKSPTQPGVKSHLTQLKELGPDVMSRVDGMLMAGDGGKLITDWLQLELGHLKHIPRDSLKKVIERYRSEDLKPRTLQRIATAQNNVPTTSVVKRLNAMDELEQMVRYQANRVEGLLFKEKGMPGGILLNQTSNEMKLLKDMLVSLGNLQLETGLLPRAAKTFKGSITDESGLVKTFSWSEEHEELMKKLELADGSAAEDL